jgi:UDP-glucose 4-epimerase
MGPFEHERVLVTGGAGFIGSHVTEALLRAGAEVVILDDMSTGSMANLGHLLGDRRLRVVEGDAAGASGDVVEGVTMGVHLAALTEVAASIEDPAGTVRANVLGSVHVLEALHKAGARAVVVASSAAVYGEVPVPVDEAGPQHPISPYGAGKLAVDHFVSYYARHTDMSTVALRFFNVYGPRQHPRSPYSGVISVFSRAAILGEPLTVTGDGEQTRDFVHVQDVVKAVMAALTAPAAGGEAINIGTGKGTTVNVLAREVVALSDSTSEVRHGPPRAGDIRHSVAKVDKAESLLGFKATTPLRDGLASTIGWMRTDPGGA